MEREHRKALHSFLLRRRRRADDLWYDALDLAAILEPYGCIVTAWDHPVLLDVGLDIFLNGKNTRLVPTKKGFRVLGIEMDNLHKSLLEIVCVIQKYSKEC